MANRIEVKVPDIGDSKDVPVIEVLVSAGDRIEKDASLIVLESEKATMEVPAPDAGVVRDIKVKVGDKLNEGDVILSLEADGEAAQPPKAAAESAPPPVPRPEAKVPPSAAAPAEKPKPSGGGGKIEVTVPDIGDYENVPIIEVLVKDGDSVEKEQALAVLESEKATMEVPAPEAGVVRGMKLKVGGKVSKGDAICTLETTGAGAAGEPAAESAPPPPAAAQPAAAPAKASTQSEPPPPGGQTPWAAQEGKPIPHASPSIRRLAREFGVDLSKVEGTGRKGRILAEDVQAFVKKNLAGGSSSGGAGVPPIPAVDFSRFGEIETKPLARIRKISAQHLSRAWLNIPHVTQTDNADITDLEAFRKEQNAIAAKTGGPKLTLLPFVVKAVAAALREFPEFNSSLAPDGENLILKKYCHLGFAADTPNGLVVPVVKDVWSKGIAQLATECGELAKKARDGKLKPDEMRGGCFSISSLGGIGGSHFTPIVNAPEVGILGVSRSSMQPVWDGKAFQPRLMCPLSLSYDHRVIDGAYAARFIVHLTGLLSDLRRLAL